MHQAHFWGLVWRVGAIIWLGLFFDFFVLVRCVLLVFESSRFPMISKYCIRCPLLFLDVKSFLWFHAILFDLCYYFMGFVRVDWICVIRFVFMRFVKSYLCDFIRFAQFDYSLYDFNRLRHYIISMPAVEHVREIVQYFVNENRPHIMKLILYHLHK